MCGLVGMFNMRGESIDIALFNRLMQESSIRGVHAGGVSYIVPSRQAIETEITILPSPTHVYLKKPTIGAIGHCRYSTSDLEWNQPIYNESRDFPLALVHNGVVTQSHPSEWEADFGVKCETKCDSEILLRMVERARHPLELKESSMACILLTSDSSIMWFRNEQRPLYYCIANDNIVIASTKDILRRTGFGADEIIQCEPCRSYAYEIRLQQIHSVLVREPKEDLQNV